MSALVRRARDLGRIADRRCTSLNVSISQKGWRKVEPIEVERDQPSVLASLLDVQLSEHGYPAQELADIVAMAAAEFGARFGVQVSSAAKGHLRAI